MKKLYATQRASHFKVSRFSFVKALSLAAAATFLSNSSPVYAKSFDIIEQVLQSIEKATAVYSQGKDKTIVSAYDSRSNSHGSHLSKANNLTALNTVKAEKVNVSVAESTNLTEKTLDSEEQYKKSLISSQPFVDNNKDTEVIDVSDFSRNNLITRMPRNAGLPRNTDGTSVVVGNGTIPHINGVDTDVVAVGIDVKVKSVDSVAVGYGSETEKEFSVAVGHLAHSVGKGSIAIGGEGRIIGKPLPPGARTIAGGEESIAIGRRAKTNNMASIAVGSNTQVNGNYAIAFGPQAQVAREDGIAIGHMAHALGKSSTAIGSEYNASGKEDYTTAKGDYSTAVGAISKAFGYGSTAVGHRAYATEKDAVSIGFYSRANTDHAIALGADSIANVAAGVAGYAPSLKGQATSTHFTWKSTYGAVSVGDITNGKTRQIGGVAAGSANTDAVNVAQLKSLQTYVDKGWKLSVDGKNAKVVGIDDTVDFAAGSKNFEITKGEGDNKVKFDLAKDITLNKITLGSNTLDATGFKIANGPQITTDGINAGEKIITAVADGKISPSSKDVINGSQLYTLANSIAATLGSNNVYINENGIFISSAYSSNGVDADGNITKDNYQTVASALEGIGQSFENVLNHFDKKVADVVKTAQDDSLLWSDDAEAFVAKHKKAGDEEGKAKTASKITFLSQGDINATSTDAINGSQLYTLGDNVAKSFGGGAGYKDGKWSAPTFTVKTVNGKGEEEEKTYKNVAAAFEGVGTSFTNVQNKFTKEITNQINNAITNVQGDSLIKKDKETNLITIGKEVSGSEINITNRENEARILSGVKAGTKSTDAVNFAQLKELAEGWKISKTGGDFKDAIADKEFSVAIGSGASALNVNTVALGGTSQATVNGGVALGAYSVADVDGGKSSYNPFTGRLSSEITYEWRSTLGAVSVGDNTNKFSRQITGVAAGTQDTDAVNVAQLKYLRKYVDKGWKLSVDGKNAKAVGIDDTVDFAAGSKNFEITKSEGDNKVTFDLAKDITLGSVTTGTNTLDATGLKIANGPQITIDGIHAGGKKITGVLEATNETDAVNFGQLNKTKQEVQEQIQKQVQEVEKQVAANSFVKQDPVTKHITIGKEVVGDEINIANNMNEARTLSGVKAAVNDNEAVNKKQLEDSLKDLSKDLQSDDSAVVHYDKQEDGTINYGSVTFGGKEKTLTALHNIADGAISSESHDAINGGQINKIGEDIAKFLGGEASFKDGAFTEPTYKLSYVATDGKVTKSSYQGVGTAFAGLDTNIKNVNQRIKEVSEGVAQDSLSWSDTDKAFSALHGADQERGSSKITHILDGNVTKGSTDAVNGSQLYSMNNTLASYLGGGAGYDTEGNWKAPTFKVKTVKKDSNEVEEISYDNVADAFAGISTSITDVHNEVNNQITNIVSDSLVKQDETGLIKIGAEKEGGAINIANKDKADRTLSGVKEAVNGNEAVNKAQLDTNIKKVEDQLKNAVNEFTENITNVTQHVQGDALLWSKTDKAFSAQHGEGDEKVDSKITHLKAGDVTADSTDAVNGSQLYSLQDQFAKYLGGGAGYDEKGKWSAPVFKVKKFDDSGKATEQEYKTVADAFEGVNQSFTNIHNEVDEKINQVVGDSLVKQDETGLIKIGAEKEGGAINIANKDKADRTLSGVKAAVNDNEAVNKAQLDTNINEVNNNLTNKFNELTENITNVTQHVQGDALLWSKTDKAFSAQHGEGDEKADRKITHLKAGDITMDSTDAINGSQLYSLQDQFAKYFGGGAGYDDKGKWSAPVFKVKKFDDNGKETEQEYTTVAEAFEGVNQSFTNIHNEVNEQINQVVGDSLVKQDEKTHVISVGGETNGTQVSFANTDGTERVLSGVKAGDLSAKSIEAVNGSQLYSMSNTLASYLGGGAGYDEQGEWSAPVFKVKKFDDSGKATEQEYTTVADAFEGVNQSFTNIHNEVNEQINQVVGDSLVKQDEKTHVISVGGETNGTQVSFANSDGIERVLSGVKAGDLSAKSTEAVNGSQVYALGSNVAQYFGGGAEYKEGNWKAPSFKVKTVKDNGESEEQEYKNVAEALTGVGTSFTNIKNEITNQINHLQSDDSAVVHYDKNEKDEIDYTSVTFGKGKNSTAVGLHNVADGQISNGSHDAVTGGQINTISQDVAKFLGGDTSFEKGVFTGPSYKLSSIDRHGQVKSTEFTDVGSAFTGLDTNIKNVNDRIKEVSEGVAQDSLSWSQDDNAFSAQHGEGKERTASKITHILDGNVTKGSTDAVNGSQLYSMNNTLASYLGGGAAYKEGNWVAPSFKVNTVNTAGDKVEEKSYDNVAAAFEGVGSSFTNLHNEVTNAVTNINNHINNVVSDSLVKQDAESKVIKIGAEKGGTSINIANSGDAARTLTGVKAGLLTEASTDAVNGSQLYSMNNTLASYLGGGAEYKEGNWVAPSFKVHTVSSDGSKVEEQSYKTVAEAFAGVGSSFTNIHKELKNEINQVVGDSLVKQDEKTHVIAVGGEKSGTEVTFANTDGASRSLTGVKAGSLTETSTEAVNGSQLFATNQNVTTVRNDLKTVSENTSKYLGGGADVLQGVAPTYTVQDKSYQSVAEAFGGVDRSFTQLHEEISKNTNEVSENIKQNALLWSESDKAFSAQHGEGKDRTSSKITSLANGSVTEDSTDAINGSQLYSMNNTLASYFGGGAKFENGQWIAPSFKVNTVSEDGSKVEEKSYDDVAKAFASVGTSFSNLHNEMTNAVTNINNQISQVVGDSLVKQDEESKVIKIGAEKEGTEITIANSDGAVRSLSGVKAGTLSADSTEAVNGSQLYSMNNTLASYFGGGAKFENGQWIAPSFKILSFNDDGSSEETSYNNVSAAFAGVNQSFTKLHHELSETVEQNALLWSDADESFVALHGKGSEKHNSKLSHLVDGDISAGSTEAITGNQLYQLNQTLAAYLGGGASYQGGQWTAPQFQITQFKSDGSSSESKSYDNVAGAFEGVNGSLSGINDRINNVAQNVSSNSLNWNDDLGGYDGRHEGKDSKITHVADGDVSEGSKEVVNGGQLWKTEQKVSAVEKRVDGIDKQVQDIALATDGSVKYDKDEAGNKTNKITLVGGNESDPVLIDNVAEGRIESGSKEAINGGQLHDYTEQQMKLVLEDAKKYTDEHVTDIVNNGVSESKAYTDMKFETLNYAVEDVRKEARQAAAIGLAVSNLRYYDIPGSVSVSFGSGLWRSQSAFAVGAGYTSEDGNIRSNVSITSAGGHWGVGAGITLRLR